jgi:NAD(P)-dependent dehydrogenase (short-subunit alcohol dehydrogenase family)
MSNSPLRFDRQVAIVTGAGAGLGRAYAHLLAARGAHVVVNNRAGRSDPQKVVDEILAAGGSAVADTHDAISECEGVVTTAVASFGRLDVVITNAGIPWTGFIAEAPAEYWRDSCESALVSTADMLKHAWPHLKDTRGRIVTTSSSASFGRPRIGPYAASKISVITLTRVAAMEGREHGIRANCVLPMAYTKMNYALPDEHFLRLLDEHCQPERVAGPVAWLAHDSVSVSGEAFTVGGGRIARVFLGVTAGWGKGDLGPEDYAAHADDIMSLDSYAACASSSEEVMWAGEQLGLDLDSKYTRT